MNARSYLLGACAALSFMLVACGGGGGVASTPPPPPPPDPPPSGQAFTIFPNPKPETYRTVGVSVSVTGSGKTMAFGAISKADADQVHIRYASGGYYEVQIPGAQWDRLTIAKGVIPADPDDVNMFQPQSAPQVGPTITTEEARHQGYQYSELAAWIDPTTNRLGWFAFGDPTLAGSVPVAGSASYRGVVHGTSDIVGYDSFDGYFQRPVDGSVDLNFDFGAGKLGGSMTLSVIGDMSPIPIGTFAFTQTVFSPGSATYSGKFNSTAAGLNYFFGQFTGPAAQETIGAWALPFLFSGDSQTHQAIGAWIAKQ